MVFWTKLQNGFKFLGDSFMRLFLNLGGEVPVVLDMMHQRDPLIAVGVGKTCDRTVSAQLDVERWRKLIQTIGAAIDMAILLYITGKVELP